MVCSYFDYALRIWNPGIVYLKNIDESKYLNQFKNNLHQLISNQEVLYDYT